MRKGGSQTLRQTGTKKTRRTVGGFPVRRWEGLLFLTCFDSSITPISYKYYYTELAKKQIASKLFYDYYLFFQSKHVHFCPRTA